MMWGCGNPDIIPWPPGGPVEGAQIEHVLPISIQEGMMSSLEGQAEWPSPQSPECSGLARLHLQNWLAHSSISNQTPVTDLSPQAILWAEHSWIPNKHLSQKTCVSFNRVQIECPKTLMLFISSTSSAAATGIPWTLFPPTLQDLLTWDVCHYWSSPIILKPCPRQGPGYVSSNRPAELLGKRCVNDCFQSLDGQQS